jgi:hypothetical protein
MRKQRIGLLMLACMVTFSAIAEDVVTYVGTRQSNPDYHHGQLSPVIGTHNIQILRANRQNPEWAEGYGWTYNHASMIAYWNNKFYVNYLSNPVNEHGQPGQTLISSSEDGYKWTMPLVIFPTYEIPVGTMVLSGKSGSPRVPSYPGLNAVMHQRMGFYVSKNNKLLALGYYGICLTQKSSPIGGDGIGRVVREVKKDGTFGDIYFIRYNKGWSEKNTRYPFYTKSKDKAFVQACNELLNNRLMVQQWNEESDADDPIISLQGTTNKAFCFYHLPDGRAVGLFKHARTGITTDEGKTWSELQLAKNVVTWNAKVWGQKTSDGRYAMVYNPSLFRWPLAIMTSNDGLLYDNLLLVHGEISPRRYEGAYKSFGPQYIRGIAEGNGTPPDGKMWLTYSMNKEDIWVASVPVPVTSVENDDVDEVFTNMKDGDELQRWNIYSPLWAPVRIESNNDTKSLVLKDWDRYDYAKAERVFKTGKKVSVSFTIVPAQTDGLLHVELQDARGMATVRLMLDENGNIKLKPRARLTQLQNYESNQVLDVKIDLDTDIRRFNININGKDWKGQWCMAPVESVERIVFRTGERRYLPTVDTEEEDGSGDLPQAGMKDKESSFAIQSLKVTQLEKVF